MPREPKRGRTITAPDWWMSEAASRKAALGIINEEIGRRAGVILDTAAVDGC